MTSAVLSALEPRSRRWAAATVWVVCGLLTAAFMLRFARNLRIADIRGAGQAHAVGDAVTKGAVRDGWSLFIRGARDDSELPALCAAVANVHGSGIPVSIARIDSDGGSRAAAECAGVPVLHATAREIESVTTVLDNTRLRLLLLDEHGRYVFGEKDLHRAPNVLTLFASRH